MMPPQPLFHNEKGWLKLKGRRYSADSRRIGGVLGSNAVARRDSPFASAANSLFVVNDAAEA
jgi:hypothetical protein